MVMAEVKMVSGNSVNYVDGNLIFVLAPLLRYVQVFAQKIYFLLHRLASRKRFANENCQTTQTTKKVRVMSKGFK